MEKDTVSARETIRREELDIETDEAMTQLSSIGNTRVRLEIVASCAEHQAKYQDICDRFQ